MRRAVETATGTLDGCAARVDAFALESVLLQPVKAAAVRTAKKSPRDCQMFLAL